MRRTGFLFLVMVVTLLPAGGVALALTSIQCVQDGACQGTGESDLLMGTDGRNQIYAREGNDVLRGFGNVDYLKGEGGNDDLFGGRTRDLLDGGPGEDTLAGGGGSDSYDLIGYGWGHDTLIDTEIPDSSTETGNLLWVDHFAGEDLVVDLVSGTGPEVRTKSGIDTVDWEGDVVDRVIALSAGDDRIRGNAGANFLAAYDGEDIVRGGSGDDLIDVGDGSGGDVVHCGKGEADTVIRDLPDPAKNRAGDNIASDCEVQRDPDVALPDGA